MVAQLVGHQVKNLVVAGSSPVHGSESGDSQTARRESVHHEGPKEMGGRSISGQCRPAWPASRRKLSVLQVRGAASGRSTSGVPCSVWIPPFQTVRPAGGLARFAIASDVIADRSTKPTNFTSARLLKQHSVRQSVINERLISRRFVSDNELQP